MEGLRCGANQQQNNRCDFQEPASHDFPRYYFIKLISIEKEQIIYTIFGDKFLIVSVEYDICGAPYF